MVTEISTLQELQDINNNLSGDYVLTSDIDASDTSGWNDGKGFVPVGDDTTSFTGTFDGQGHTISDLYINRSQENNAGLFGYADGSTIENIGVENVDVSGDDRVGGLVGFNRDSSTVSNSYATGTVSGNDEVGGLVGYNRESSVSNSYSTGTVSGSNSVGGLVGLNNVRSTVSNSYATGTVSGSNRVGGLVGYHYTSTTVQNSYATGDVSGSNRVGGLVGRVLNNEGVTDEILYSYANSDINPDLDLIGGDDTSGTLNTTGSSLKTTAEMTDYANDYPEIQKVFDNLEFDGTDDYVEVPDIGQSGFSAYTLSFWVKLNKLDVYNGVHQFNTGGAVSRFYILDSNLIRLRWRYDDDTDDKIDTSYTVPKDKWIHMVGVVDTVNGFQGIYVNGDLKTSSSSTGTLEPDGGVTRLGRTYAFGSDNFINGKIDDARIYDRALSESEITELYNDGKRKEYPSIGDEVGHWKLNKGHGTIAYDSSGNGNHGTLKPDIDPPIWVREGWFFDEVWEQSNNEDQEGNKGYPALFWETVFTPIPQFIDSPTFPTATFPS